MFGSAGNKQTDKKFRKFVNWKQYVHCGYMLSLWNMEEIEVDYFT